MPRINLKDFYDWCKEDEFVEVTDEMLETMKTADRQEAAYKRRMYRHKAQYSLDCNDGIENAMIYRELSPEEIYLWKEKIECLCIALNSLPEIQGRRVDAYYLEGLNFRQIAAREGVSQGAVSDSVKIALKKMRKMLE